jgi:preprotein translocase SecE subunit
MGIGLYKPGQGYWVRVMSAAFAGIIVLIACAWLWNMLATVQLPTPTWSMNVVSPAGQTAIGEAAPGQQVVFSGEVTDPTKAPPEIATAEVASLQPSTTTGQTLVVRKMTFKLKFDQSQIRSVAMAPGATGTLKANVVGTPQGKPIFDGLYLQAGGVTLLIVLGGVIVYLFVGARPSTVEFLIATDGEMKKVNWSTKKDIIGSTQVVIMWSVLLVGGLFLVDLLFSTVFRLIGVLQTGK